MLWSEDSKFKLMCEFTALATGKTLLRIEYDPACVRREEVQMLQVCVPKALSLLADGIGYEEIKQRLAEWDDGGVYETGRITEDYFGLGLGKI